MGPEPSTSSRKCTYRICKIQFTQRFHFQLQHSPQRYGCMKTSEFAAPLWGSCRCVHNAIKILARYLAWTHVEESKSVGGAGGSTWYLGAKPILLRFIHLNDENTAQIPHRDGFRAGHEKCLEDSDIRKRWDWAKLGDIVWIVIELVLPYSRKHFQVGTKCTWSRLWMIKDSCDMKPKNFLSTTRQVAWASRKSSVQSPNLLWRL